jgi:hypothetical protein
MDDDDMNKFWEEFNNRRIYTELSVEILETIPDDELEQAIVDYIFTKVTDEQTKFADISKLSVGFQMVYSTWVLETQVNNGGFNQFFFNPSGQFAMMALQSLEYMRASDYYEVMRRAMEMREREKEIPDLQALYQNGTLQAFSETYKLSRLDECDEAFYKLGDRLGELRINYVRSHPKEFVSN